MNGSLRQALDSSEVDEATIATRLGVDRKTVDRWVAGRVPYPRYRRALAELLDIDAQELWPHAARPARAPSQESAKIEAVYAHRWAVPRKVWLRLFSSAQGEIGILAYAALFLAEDDGILRVIADRARSGVRVRILLGNPDSPHVAERGAGEGIGVAIAAKIRNALALYEVLSKIEPVELRIHSTTLYASIYRADNDLLINTHAYGASASHAPIIHVRHTAPSDVAETYLTSFDHVWNEADDRESPSS